MNKDEIEPKEISKFGSIDESTVDDYSAIQTHLKDQIEQLTCEIAVLRDIVDDQEKIINALSLRLRRLEESIENSRFGDRTLDRVDELHALMIKNGIRQLSFSQIATLLGISHRRANQLKAALDNDSRFEVVRSKTHKQKLLVRIAKVKTDKPRNF